jgi:TIR domain-containing protein
VQNKPVIFISYSHEDEPTKPGGGPAWLSFVRRYLQPAVKNGIFDLFVDEHLHGGDLLDAEIERKLRACDIFILLVSASSMASDYVVDTEIRIIRERQANGEAVHFYPLLLTPTPEAALAKLRDMVIRPENGTPLSSFAYNEQLEQITAIANEIAELAQAIVARKPQAPPRAPQPTFSHITGLPETAYERLVGRDAELKRLDDAWSDNKTNILSLIAEGGAGKSALVNEWLTRLQTDSYRGAEAVLGWSFYSQGSKERATSAEGFLNWALEKLGIKLETTSASQKGEAIAEALAQRRILLVLDGVEPLQHGPGSQVGQLKDLGLRSLLRRFASVSPAETHGLIVLTSRVAVADIARWKDSAAPVRDVERLSEEAGAALLRDNGVWGTAKELKAATKEFGGHPLALSLLATFLKETQLGDVRRRDRVHAFVENDDNPLHAHARRMMASYEDEWLKDQPVLLAILHMVGLFDRPASDDCLAALRREPVIAGLTDEIVTLDDAGWNRAVVRLRDVRLLAPLDRSAPDALDAHPLVREWFGERLREKNENAWREAHGRLYEYLRDATTEGEMPALDDLAPLYQAITHGCRAGRHEETLTDIYRNRICRRDHKGRLKFDSMYRLGAFGSDLAAMTSFFRIPFELPVTSLQSDTQSWVLSVASLALSVEGRLKESIHAVRAGLDQEERTGDWENAAISAQRLSIELLLSGNPTGAIETARSSEESSRRCGDNRLLAVGQLLRAGATHASGRRDEAEALFESAEKLHVSLYRGGWGRGFFDFLLSKSEWMSVCDRASASLKVSSNKVNLGLDALALGRAHHGEARGGQHESVSRTRDYVRTAGSWIDASVADLVASGYRVELAYGLLYRAAFRCGTGDWAGAARDLDEVEEIAEPGPMRLFLCDMALERARLVFAQIEAFAPLNGMLEQDNPPKPEELSDAEKSELMKEAAEQIENARKLIESCGYHRRDAELAELQSVLRGERTFASLPPRV